MFDPLFIPGNKNCPEQTLKFKQAYCIAYNITEENSQASLFWVDLKALYILYDL